MSRLRAISLPNVCLALVLGGFVALLIGGEVYFAIRERRAARENRPDVVLTRAEADAIVVVDPVHLRLPDGRTFRLAGLVSPPPGTPEAADAAERVIRSLTIGWNRECGLRTLGTNAAGETLADLWGFRSSRGGCASRTWFESRDGAILRWESLGSDLVAMGCYRLEPGITDRDLIAAERYARRQAYGIWANPAILRVALDVPALERDLDVGRSDGPDVRGEAAELLMRMDAKTYAPRLLAIVKSRDEENVYARTRMAQILEKSGDFAGTDFLMAVLADGGQPLGLDVTSLNSIVSSYDTFWNAQVHDGSHGKLLRHYQSVVRPKATSQPVTAAK